MAKRDLYNRITTNSVVDWVRAKAFPKRLHAVPHQLTTAAVIPGIPNARFLLSTQEGIDRMVDYALEMRRRHKQDLTRRGHEGPLPPIDFLAISGGGDKGSFAAGLITGWTESGSRPDFAVVTGISTGALIAPFAYVGPEYDKTLKSVFRNIKPRDIFLNRKMTAALLDDAMKDSTPLWNLVGKYVNQKLLEKIAEKYSRGPSLFIATTNLDARLPVIWNMGEIAASKDPKALELFRKIVLASASIPGVFPPVMIDVEVDGAQYQEMHVDGGAVAQVFLFPASLGSSLRERGLWVERKRTAYIIRNARLDPDWASVDRRTLSILGRSISSLIQTQGVADLYHIYLITKQDEMEYNLAYIGREFDVLHKEDFNTKYMRALFDYAFEKAKNGYPWHKKPSGLFDPHLTEQIQN